MEEVLDLDFIKNRRKDLNIPSGDFAAKLGLSASYWSNIEGGNRTIPSELLVSVARLLDCSLDDLFVEKLEDKVRLAPGVAIDRDLAEDLARLIQDGDVDLLRSIADAVHKGPPGLRQAIDFLLSKGD